MTETKKNNVLNTAAKSGAGLIFKQIPKAMKKIEFISKDKKNQAQGYSFRGIDDVYNELHQILVDCEIFTVPNVLSERHEERRSAKGAVLIYRIFKIMYTFYASDGSNVSASVMGEGMDGGDKASNKAMAVAHKYTLLQVFAIPTDDPKDPEVDSPQVGDFRSDISGGSDPFMGTDKDTSPPDSKPKSPREKTGKVEKTKPPEEDDQEKYRTIQLILSDGHKKMVSKFEALDYFGKLKGVLGELSYYAILAQDGYKSSKDMPPEAIPGMYAKMIEAFNFAKSKEEGNSPQQGDSDEPVF